MKANEIEVGQTYVAKVSGNEVPVRVDSIREKSYTTAARYPATGLVHKTRTVYDVTNLKTKRKVTFRSAQKFRRKAVPQKIVLKVGNRVMIYEDPITRLKPEGMATLKKLVRVVDERFLDWMVEFDEGTEGEFCRTIVLVPGMQLNV